MPLQQNLMHVLFVLTLFTVLQSTHSSRKLLKILKKQGYDSTMRPGEDEGVPTNISLDVFFEDFGKIDDVQMEVNLYMYVRQTWIDKRLRDSGINRSVTLNRANIDQIWRPDTYCSNARDADLMIEDKNMHTTLKIFPNGFVFYSRNTHIVAACKMNLRNFPMDVQNCNIILESYGYNSSEVVYQWKSPQLKVGNRDLAQFHVLDVQTAVQIDTLPLGNYIKLIATFQIQRRIGYFLIQLYFPCIFIVMLSWVVFWMNPENNGDRLTVGITTILTIVFLLGYVNGMLPKVSYPKGVDWYLMSSFTFIFLSLIECVIIERLYHRNKQAAQHNQGSSDEDKPPEKSSDIPHSPRIENESTRESLENIRMLPSSDAADPLTQKQSAQELDVNEEEGPSEWNAAAPRKPYRRLNRILQVGAVPSRTLTRACRSMYHESSTARKIDVSCRVLFPLTYVIYNIVYWSVYLGNIEVL